MITKLYRTALTYGIAIASTAIALMLTVGLTPWMSRTSGAFFYVAVIVSTGSGGSRAGWLCMILSALTLYYHLNTTEPPLPDIHGYHLLPLTVFVVVATLINGLSDRLRQSKRKVEQLSQQLQRESADRLHMALNAAHMGTWEWNMETGEIQWSPEHELLFGGEPGRFDGRYETFDRYIHPDDREALNQAVAQALEHRTLYHFDYRIIWADGSVHWIEGRGQAVYNERGIPVKMVGTVMAIDERKQAELQLQQQYEQQRLVMDIAQRIRRSLHLRDILQTTVDEVQHYLQADRVIIFEFEPGWGGRVTFEAVGKETFAILHFNIHDPCIGEENVEPFKHGCVTAKSDIYNSGISPCHIEFLEQFQVKANLVAPIVKGDDLWGLLIAHHCQAPRPWQPWEIELLKQVTAQVNLALQQADLLEQLQTELAERKQAEAALRQSEARLRLAQRASNSAVWDWDLRAQTVLWSPEHYQLYDLEPTVESSYENWLRCLHPDDQDRVHQNILWVIQSGHSDLRNEFRVMRSDGLRWFAGIGQIFRNAEGEATRIIGIAIDITAQKQAELALQQLNAELEQRVAARTTELIHINDRLLESIQIQQRAQAILLEQAQLLELAHDTIITCDLDWVITFWNQGAERIYGWSKGEALGQNVHRLLHTQFPQSFEEIRTQLFQQDYWEGELIHYCRADRQITALCRWVVQRNETGQPVKILEINNDITARKQAELSLQQYAREVEDLYNNAPCGYHSIDAEGTIVRMNDTELNWLGYPREEVVNRKKLTDFLTPESQQVFAQNFPQFRRLGSLNDVELQLVSQDGTTRWVSINAIAIYDEAGNYLMSRTTLFDISDRRKLDQIKQDFISVVSHELRTPLTSIRGALGLIAAGIYDQKPDKIKSMIDIAARQSDRLVRLVNDILDLRRLESGQHPLHFRSCPAADLLRQAVDGMRSLAEQHQIYITILPAEVEIWADADAIVQTLTNLLSNAIKFSPAESTITLSATLQIPPTEAGDFTLFTVQDQGRGIPADLLDSIFGQFQQVDASDSREKGGTGLGLAICRTIVEQHYGRIWVESVLGQGSTFYFTIPVAPNLLPS